MPVIPTLALSKTILRASRALGRGGGSALPGLVAEKVDPTIGAKLAARIPHGSIIITGTNGKTTTAKMMRQVLADAGERIVGNRAGSNLSRGVVSALIEHANASGNFSETMGLFEVDEAAMPAVASMVQPRAIIVLNLFRDQLDRYGELDTTAKLVGEGIARTRAKLFLNADDPLVASLAQYAANPDDVVFFGIKDTPVAKLEGDVTSDSDTCPVCSEPLEYTKTFFGHIGHYRCKNNHIKRPKPHLEASDIKLADQKSTFSFSSSDKNEHSVTINLPGLYNIYNALAALQLSDHLGIPNNRAVKALSQVKAAFGRIEKIQIDGRTLYLLLVKNPTGFNQVIQTFLLRKKQQEVLFIINDNFADGRDVSWLWDVAFEELESSHHTYTTAGSRANDMALRLKYAELPTYEVIPSVPEALNHFIAQLPPGGTGYVIPTYTAMLEARKYLGTKTDLEGIWQ